MTTGSRVFAALVSVRDRAYRRGLLPVTRLDAPVVSVGNLSVGGSGKTPTVIALAQAFTAYGCRCDVLTRGYGRSTSAHLLARGDESPALAGDEPLLIARHTGVPVLVDADRVRAGRRGEAAFASQLHLLDDGFQHRRLARSFDLVLVQSADFSDRLLPAGRLREPLSALARADAVLAVERSDGEIEAASIALHTPAPVYFARRWPRPLATHPARPLAFCALARPDSFLASLAEVGIVPAAAVSFRDHHAYSAADLEGLRARAAATGADGFITTAKDAIKLEALPRLPDLTVLEIEMRIPRLESLVTLMLEACGL